LRLQQAAALEFNAAQGHDKGMRAVMGLKGLKNTLNYGADRIRYLSPVPAGSRLRGRVSIAEAEDMPPNGLRVHYRVVIEIEGGQRPACVAEVIGMHYR
jgi:acyl dehydratase